ncbi:MAG: biotin/lipoyl-binding protein [Spirochaetaceae bacterium]|nr:biotin/lipoyl-binding protein [Spirochaetaceae bacterium]
MKRYKITVNGQTYDVTVEEIAGTGPLARTVAPAAQEAKAAPAVVPAPAAVAAATNLPVSLSVKSPMPGVVMSFKVAAGQDVKKGDVLLILEAMKMENEIVAPQAGKILSLRVPAGASVNTGDSLVDLG